MKSKLLESECIDSKKRRVCLFQEKSRQEGLSHCSSWLRGGRSWYSRSKTLICVRNSVDGNMEIPPFVAACLVFCFPFEKNTMTVTMIMPDEAYMACSTVTQATFLGYTHSTLYPAKENWNGIIQPLSDSITLSRATRYCWRTFTQSTLLSGKSSSANKIVFYCLSNMFKKLNVQILLSSVVTSFNGNPFVMPDKWTMSECLMSNEITCLCPHKVFPVSFSNASSRWR